MFCRSTNSAKKIFQLNKTNFDLIKLINSTISQNKLFFSEKKLNVVFNHKEQECIIYADMIQIERVIENLLANAITYSFSNTDIIINLFVKDRQIVFSISNKSNFISQKELKNIFNKFAQTKNSQLNKNSTGLGLYNVKQIISLHGGKIYATSSVDGTCTFGFKIEQNQNIRNLINK